MTPNSNSFKFARSLMTLSQVIKMFWSNLCFIGSRLLSFFPRRCGGIPPPTPEPNDGAAISEHLPVGLRPEFMPKHVAVIMDGSGRWARMRGLPASAGHKAGVESLLNLIDTCLNWDIKVLSVFAFSTDNWVRSKVDVDFLMTLFEGFFNSHMESFKSKGIRISIIGDSSKLPQSLQKTLTNAQEAAKENSELHLIVAINYSGKYDIVQTCKNMARKVKDGLIQLEDINENQIELELETNCSIFPNPDLLIRSSGELRVSNFFLWQLAYTEFSFSNELWPDFGKAEFLQALVSFQQRKRRFGGQNLSTSTSS